MVSPSDDGVKMPQYLSELSILIFLEAQLFVREDADGGGVLGPGDRGFVRIEVPGALLYGGYARASGAGFGERAEIPFLCVGTKADGPLYVIAGGPDNTDFDILSDGIVG